MTTTEPLTPECLAEMKQAWAHTNSHESFRVSVSDSSTPGALTNALVRAVKDVPALLAEVERLQSEIRNVVPAAERDRLWKAILDTIGGLPYGNSSRSTGYFSASGPFLSCRCVYSVQVEDGSWTVYDLESRRNASWPVESPQGSVTVQTRTYRDDRDDFWQPLVDVVADGRSVIVNGEHYRIADEPHTGAPDNCRGFGGRQFTIAFFDGRTVTTRNLWQQGIVPPAWRESLPDNARFTWPAQDGAASS